MNEIRRVVVREFGGMQAKHYILNFGFQKILLGPCGNQGVVGWGTLGRGSLFVPTSTQF